FFAAGAAAEQQTRELGAADARLARRLLDAEDHRRADDPAFAHALETRRRPALKSQALVALGRIGDPSSVELVASFLENSLASLREDAAFALGLLGGDVAVDALLAAEVEEPNARVRR